MQKLSYILVVLIGVIFAFSCINNKKNVNQLLATEDNALKGIGLLGTYEGNLPCADCSMISTLLSLDKNKQYHLRYIYVGKSEEVFERRGNWSVNKGILTLENVDYNYKIMDNQLNQLDLSGKEIKGELAEKYTLMKIK
ncbi:copper resistance protein NlpE [Sphingobacterium humi]|uniref:Copper resistance protein NlpE n=1 Tax=Sphingobacterium humi TaxID=1796905 RepID=A0A6N8KZF5_9SPHI|nr:copper resistance protein NlpE [Sphingobacterium humi]MVZ62850.1 copper resistance protein NlpE [Sphingobacterium humi]